MKTGWISKRHIDAITMWCKLKYILSFLVLILPFVTFLPINTIACSLSAEGSFDSATTDSTNNQHEIPIAKELNIQTQTESGAKLQSAFSYEVESNNSKETATSLSVNTTILGNNSMSSDNDWYVIALPDDGYITIQFEHEAIESTNGLWRCYIYQADGNTLIDSSNYHYYITGDTSSNTLPSVGLAKGTYYINIAPYSSSQYSSVDYTLTVHYDSADNWECESNSTKYTAQSISVNKTINGSIYTPADIDWFVFTLPYDGYINISFDHVYVDSNDRLWKYNIYQSDGSSSLDGSSWYWYSMGNKISDQPTVHYADHPYFGLSAGTYYIKLEGYSSSQYSNKDYTLAVNSFSAKGWEKESNSTKATAQSIELNSPLHGSIMTGGDIDWFKLIVDKESDVSISFMHDAIKSTDSIDPSDYFWDIYFYKSDGSTSATGYYYHIDGSSKVNTITAESLDSGTYYIKIVPYSSIQWSSLHYILEFGDGSNLGSNTLVRIIQTSLSSNKIEINGQGIGYAYFKLIDENHLPITNRTVTYSYSGYSDIYTTKSDSNGEVVVQTPTMINNKSLTLNIQSVSGITGAFAPQTINVTVTPLSFEQKWNGTLGAGGGVSAGIGVGGKIGVAEGEVKIADIGAKANAKPSMMFTNSYDNGNRSLEITNTVSAEVSANAKAGLFAKVDVAKTGVKITPAGIKGDVSAGGYTSIGLKIDDYDPYNADHIAKIGGYLLNNAVTANGSNVMTSRLLELLNLNSYNKTAYGTKIMLGAGAKLGAVEVPFGKSGYGTDVTLVGGNATTVYSYDSIQNTNGQKSYKTGYKTDGKISFGEFGIIRDSGGESGYKATIGVPTSIYAASFLGNDSTLSANSISSGLDSLELVGGVVNSSDQITWYNESERKYTKYKYTGNELKSLNNENDNIKSLFAGTKGLFSPKDLFNTIDYISNSGMNGSYSVATKKEKGIDAEFSLGVKALLGAEVSLFISGIESVGFDIEKGVLSGGRVLKQSEAPYIENLVNSQRLSLETILSEPILGLGKIVGSVISKAVDSVANGVQNGAAAVQGVTNDVSNRIISIFKPKTPVGMQRSYLLKASPNEFSLMSETHVAVTVGEPYIVEVTEADGKEIPEFDPLSFKLEYDEAMLTTAGIASNSSLINSMKIYYWDIVKNGYICKGGVLDKVNRKVTLDITKGGQYILAIDNLAPDIKDFVVSNNTQTPVITANISDISGIDESTFKFSIDNNVIVNGDTLKDYYDFTTGNFKYEVKLPLSEGVHIASIIIKDTSGNALPQAKICQFNVDAQPPTIDNVIIPQNINAGEDLSITVKATGADRTFAYIAYPTENGWSEFESLNMANISENTWNTQIVNTVISNQLKVKVLVYDSSGNMSESSEAIVNIVVDKSELKALILKARNKVLNIEEGTDIGRYQIGTLYMLETAISNATSIITDTNSTQEEIDEQITALDTAIEALDNLLIVDPYMAKLTTAISNAKVLLESKTIGTAAGNVSQTAYDDYNTAITSAVAVQKNASATKEEADAAFTALATATTAFNDAIIPAIKTWMDWTTDKQKSANESWTITFKKEVDPSSVNTTNIYVSTDEAGTNKVAGTSVIQVTGNAKQVKVSPPSAGWHKGSAYYLFISEQVKSTISGQNLKNGVRMRFNVNP